MLSACTNRPIAVARPVTYGIERDRSTQRLRSWGAVPIGLRRRGVARPPLCSRNPLTLAAGRRRRDFDAHGWARVPADGPPRSACLYGKSQAEAVGPSPCVRSPSPGASNTVARRVSSAPRRARRLASHLAPVRRTARPGEVRQHHHHGRQRPRQSRSPQATSDTTRGPARCRPKLQPHRGSGHPLEPLAIDWRRVHKQGDDREQRREGEREAQPEDRRALDPGATQRFVSQHGRGRSGELRPRQSPHRPVT